MIARRLGVVALLALLALGSACTKTEGGLDTRGSSTSGAAPTTEQVDAPSGKKVFKGDQREIAVVVGEKFAIRLSENASIGDAWRVVSEPDGRLVESEGTSVKSDVGPDEPPRAGAGAQREFKYKARAAGVTTVTVFNCYRCGNGTVAPDNEDNAERLTFTVTIT